MKKFYYLVNRHHYPVNRPSEEWFVNKQPSAEAIEFILYAEHEGRKFETMRECLANLKDNDFVLVTDVVLV